MFSPQKYLGHRIGSSTAYETYYSDGEFEDLLATAFKSENEEDVRMDISRPFLTANIGKFSTLHGFA